MTEKNAGISFLVRIRNEEETLEASIRSLFGLTIPHEIILILHLCNDSSGPIASRLAEENSNIKIYSYTMDISRPGYETLATDVDSPHSIMTYYNLCRNKATYPWTFKWDADFIATPRLIEHLNQHTWEKEDKSYNIRCKSHEMDTLETYLHGNLVFFKKYFFWEVPYFMGVKDSFPDDAYIIHQSELAKMKTYWHRVPWYEKEDSEEAKLVQERIRRLVEDYGPEPVGAARCCNDECDVLSLRIVKQHPSYVHYFK